MLERRLFTPMRRLRRSRSGATAIMVALMLPALIAAVGLATDVSLWLLQQHRLQIAADAAAHAAGFLIGSDSNPADYQAVAASEARSVTGGTLPSGIAAPHVVLGTNMVSVTLSATVPALFSSAVGIAGPTLSATATAGRSLSSTSCILALDPALAGAISLTGAGAITARNCSIFADSNSPGALYLTGIAVMTATTIGTVGNYGGLGLTGYSPSPLTGQIAEADPFANATPPVAPIAPTAADPGCTYNSAYNACCNSLNQTFTGAQSFSAANSVFCGSTTFASLPILGGTISFAPNTTYYFVGGSGGLFPDSVKFGTFGNLTLAATNHVTFALVGPSPPDLIFLGVQGLSLNGPLPSVNSGALIWQACRPGGGQLLNFTGATSLTFSGLIYAPCANISFFGVSVIQSVNNTLADIVADSIAVVGGGGINIQGLNRGTPTPGPVAIDQ